MLRIISMWNNDNDAQILNVLCMTSDSYINRHMIVMSGEKKGLTAKHVPLLATVSTRVEGSVLFLSAPGQETISVKWKEAAKSGHVERFM